MGIKLGGDYDDTQREGVTVADISLSVGGGEGGILSVSACKHRDAHLSASHPEGTRQPATQGLPGILTPPLLHPQIPIGDSKI